MPKITEIHKELSNLRQKLETAERLNDYLRKQIEIYHITQGNLDSLLEMAHKLDLTQDELEQYKEKLFKIQTLKESLLPSRSSQQQPQSQNNSIKPICKQMI